MTKLSLLQFKYPIAIAIPMNAILMLKQPNPEVKKKTILQNLNTINSITLQLKQPHPAAAINGKVTLQHNRCRIGINEKQLKQRENKVNYLTLVRKNMDCRIFVELNISLFQTFCLQNVFCPSLIFFSFSYKKIKNKLSILEFWLMDRFF